MLEEKNDNLLEADGNLETEAIEANQMVTPVSMDSPSNEEKVLNTDETSEDEKRKALDAIEDNNAAESEDETLKERHQIPMLDYDTLLMEALVEELKKLVTTEKVMSIKEHVDEIKKAFLSKYYHFIEEKKEEFHAENPDSTEEFQYHYPLKSQFDQYYTQYKEDKNAHFKSLQNNY